MGGWSRRSRWPWTLGGSSVRGDRPERLAAAGNAAGSPFVVCCVSAAVAAIWKVLATTRPRGAVLMADQASVTASAAGTIDIGGDLTVNRLGFGAMRITGSGIWGEPPDRDAAKAVLRRAVELDVNFIDTADSYGPGGWPSNGRPEHLKEACEGSLRRLRLEQIALYQLHRPDPRVPLEESVGALVQLKEQGKIRHIGLSNVTEDQLRRAQRLTAIVSIQNRYNLGDRESDSLIDLCEQEELVFLPWAPIQDLGGHPALREIAERHRATARQVVLAWLLARSLAVLPIPGTGTVAHLEDNVAAVGLRLSAAEVDALRGGATFSGPAR